MSVMFAENSPSAIWQRTIERKKSRLDPSAARALLQLKFSQADLRRADALAAKARAGNLSAAEERELEDYRAVGTALEFLKSKARLTLKRFTR
jgi:phage portal protein BeeE